MLLQWPATQAVLALLAWGIALEQAGAVFDEAVLIQRELKASQPPPSPRAKIVSKNLIQKAINTLDGQLEEFLEKHDVDLNRTRHMKELTGKYLVKMSANQQSKGILADLTDEADGQVAVMVLGFLRDPQFLQAARRGLTNMTNAVQTFSLRTEKRITELVVAQESRTSEEMPAFVEEFFQKEVHIIKSVVDIALANFMRILAAAPGYEAVVGDVVQPMVDDFKASLAARLQNMLKVYVDSKGVSFCNNPLVSFTQEWIPFIAEIKNKLHTVEAFVHEKAPDVEPAANELLAKFGKMTTSLADRLKTGLRLSAQKVCAVIGQPVAGPLELMREPLNTQS